MATGRQYRDYTLDDDPSELPAGRSPSPTRAADAAGTIPRIIVSDMKPDDEGTMGSRSHGRSIARAADDTRRFGYHDDMYGAGIAQTRHHHHSHHDDYGTGIAQTHHHHTHDAGVAQSGHHDDYGTGIAQTRHHHTHDAAVAQSTDDGRASTRHHTHGAGIAHPTDDGRTSSHRDYGTGIAHSTDDGGASTRHHTHSAAIVHSTDNGRTSSHRDYSTGIAHSTDDGRTSSNRDYGTGIAQTTDSDHATPYEDEPSETTLHHAQVDPPPTEITADAISADMEKRAFSPSVASISNASQGPQSSGASTRSKMPEFFGQAVFHLVLLNPTTAHQLLKFGQSQLCGENLQFLARVNEYHDLLTAVSKSIFEMHRDFISTTGSSQINLPDHLNQKVNNDMKLSLASTLPELENIFVSAQMDIERLVHTNIYPKFVRHQMGVSAARALGTDRSKYGGLGDCFVLTDPAKADNPIVYASDGFVKVTGYSRTEIIPRNCRFLQNRHTDRSAVRRLKASIDKREEFVELILNQKKNGEPFWNLLYTAPLHDAHGKLVFFLGAQINCSTTIHNASDVLRILGQATEADDKDDRATSPAALKPQTSRGRNFLNAFRSTNRAPSVQQRAPGMENVLLDRLDDMDLKNQMNSFYNAYSNYLIINASSNLIAFASAGILAQLIPLHAKPSAAQHPHPAAAVGSEIFKFLSAHSSAGSLSREFKGAVRGALKAGQPLSVDVTLCARPAMGFERFVSHWTPLKDEVGAVCWVVMTLGSEVRG